MSTNQSSWPNSGQILQLYIWKFCRWGADVPPGETSLAVRNREKQLYSQATIALPPLKNYREKLMRHLKNKSCHIPAST